MNFQGEYIYIIREREFIKSRDDIFKVGRSGGIIRRMVRFPKGSSVRCIVKVADAIEAKCEVLALLKMCKSLTHCIDIGEEYFRGNIETIIDIVTQVATMLHAGDTDKDEDTDEGGDTEEDLGDSDTSEDEDTSEEEDTSEDEDTSEEEEVDSSSIGEYKRQKIE
jgi:hypothetical protein